MEEQQTNSMIIENSSLDHTTPETSSNEQPSPEEIQENHENQESEGKREELREIENHLEEKKEEKREEPPEMEISTKPTEEIISERFDHPKIEDGINEQKKDRPIPIFIRDEQIPYLLEHLRGKDFEAPTMNVISAADPISDEYIEYVARTGKPLFEWHILRPLLFWKLERIMLDMAQQGPFDHLAKVPNTDRSSSRQYIERILQSSRTLPGVPFTIQRICELLSQPKKHYKRADKFFRALEKNISVVTTVDHEGRRETERQPDDNEDSLENFTCNDESLYK